MLGQHRRWWPNIKPPLAQCLVLAGVLMVQPIVILPKKTDVKPHSVTNSQPLNLVKVNNLSSEEPSVDFTPCHCTCSDIAISTPQGAHSPATILTPGTYCTHSFEAGLVDAKSRMKKNTHELQY